MNHELRRPRRVSRRDFLAATAAGAIGSGLAPAVLTASKTDSQVMVGEGDYRYQVLHDWPQLPDRFPGRRRTTLPSIATVFCT